MSAEQREADRLAREAAHHKGRVTHHRKALRSRMKQLADLRQRCAELGITIIDTAQEAKSNDRSDRTSRNR